MADTKAPARVANNIMRHNYRKLSEQEQTDMGAVKAAGLVFVELLHSIGGSNKAINAATGNVVPCPPDEDTKQRSRELAVAQTKIEEAVMWAVKHITR